jgi:hypothetical protein
MNSKILILFLAILLLGSVSAAEWDNKLDYSNEDLKVNFTNSILGIIPTTNIGSAELKSHKSVDEIRTVPIGKDRTVMWYDFDFEEIYPEGLGEVIFINQRTGEEIQKDYYFAEFVTGQQPKFETICREKFNPNGTSYTKCSQVQNGFKKEWKKLDLNNIPKGKTTIGLITDVEIGDYIDAIWNIVGKEVSKHAFWIAGESNTRQTTLDPIFTLENQGTNVEFGINITIGYENIFLTKATMIVGVTADTAYVIHNNGTLMDTQAITSENAIFNLMLLGNETYYVLAGDPTDLWTTKREDSLTFPIDMTEVSFISGVQGASYPYNTDAARAWNIKSLDLAPAILLPTKILNSPIDNFNTTNPSITFNVTINHTIPDNVTLFIDDVGNETNATGILGDYIFNKILTEGIHTWNIQDCSVGGCENATARTFTIDTTSPTITIDSPTPIYTYLYEDYNLTLNTTITETYIDTCWKEYNSTNTTFSCSTGVKSSTGFPYAPGQNSLTIWANDSAGNQVGNTTTWTVKLAENLRTFNTTSFDTSGEIFSINITANASLSNVYLNYSDTFYPTTKSGTVWSKSLQVPTSKVGNNLLNFVMTYAGTNYSSLYDYQNISSTVFTLCNATYTTKFLNISFKDENDLTVINATIPTSSFIYYIGSGTVNKTLTYSNVTVNYDYTFCSTVPGDLNVIPSLQYKQGADYPQRIWNPSTQIYNSTLTNKILYLLKATDGIYVTYQVLDGTGGQLTGVNVNATRTIEGETVLVGTGQTDAAGLVTFWMNPDFVHTVTFEKTGYTSFTLNHFPTQSSYTVTLGTSSTSGVNDYLRGVSWHILPILGINLEPNTFYNFNLTLNSSYWTLDSFGFNLYGDGSVIGGNTSTESDGVITNLINTSGYSHIIIDYYWVINGTTTDATSGGWFIFDSTEGTGWSIGNFFTDLSTYSGQGIFGLSQNALNFIIFVIIFVSVGLVSYRFGISSPGVVSGMVFALVFLFDFALGMIDIGIGIANFPTIFVGLVTVALIVKESTT